MEMTGSTHFTCIGRGHGAPAVPATREEWEAVRREPWLAEMCERIEKGQEELKHRLPVWTPHCAEFKNNHRAIADAVRPLRRLMFDFDEKGHTEEILNTLNARTAQELSGMVVLLVEDSVRRGTHVLVQLPDGMSAAKAQQVMKEVTTFTPDAAVKDVARCIYMVPESHTRFVSPKLFETPEETALTIPAKPAETTAKPAVTPAKPAVTPASPTATAETSVKPVTPVAADVAEDAKEEPCFKGIPYAAVVKEWWRRNGGEPQQGERNVKLHKLAVNLRAICDNKPEVLMQVMPRYGLTDTELRSIVDSACKEPTKGSRTIDLIVASLQDRPADDETADEATADGGSESQAPTLGTLYRHLPLGLKESLVGVPVTMHLPVLCSVMPIAATYADQVTVEYCDGNTHRLGLMSIIRGEQASNKSVCKNAVDVWKRLLDEEDNLARKREEEWKERKKNRKANEKAPDDPHVLIRVVPVTVSCSTLLKRFKNAQGHTIYSFGEELDTLRKTNGAGSWSSKYDIYRLSFDYGEWGQDYNSDVAESGVVNVAYNWNMLGTNGAMRKCFKSDNIENGLSSRILVAEMPDSAFSKLTKFGKRSAADEARIQEAATRLRSFTGLIDVPRLRKAIENWVEEKRVEAAKDIDRVKDTYRKRAAVIGFRCGVIFHLLSGRKLESRHCLRFALMMAEYCLQQQIKTFGEALRNEYVSAHDECQRYGVNHSIFDQLPPVFTMNDLRALKQGYCGDSALRNITCRWHRDGWIVKTDARHWTKTSQRPNVPTSH